jgi:peptidoglycan/xylan/chitin deacetylase (PgdA/CDA1 family)
MDWEHLLIVPAFLFVFSIITITVLFYLRHWASRSSNHSALTSTEGKYFKRYIPEELRRDYDNNNDKRNKFSIKHRSLWAKRTSAVVVLAMLTLSAYSIAHNVYIFLTPINLNQHEIKKLDYTHHQWKRNIDVQLPSLSNVLTGMHVRGFIVPYSSKGKHWIVHGNRYRNMALNHWRNFAKENRFSILQCKWTHLSVCQAGRDNWIILALPGYWDFKKLDHALKHGSNIILYGPPAQLFSDKEIPHIQWHDLTFNTALKREAEEIILRGDQVLTLGFDAGLIVNATSPFEGYMAFADRPQAVSIGSIYEAGGYNETRLFAQKVENGRLVWMDFPPSDKDHDSNINITYLNALMASILRYLSQQTYSAIATWPEAKSFAAMIEEDSEDKFENAENVVKLVNKSAYPISWYILSNEALKHRSLVQDMAKSGEIACHGDNHGVFTKSSPRDQVIRIARCKKILLGITGIKPLSFRPPEEEYNSATVDAIINNGMTHYIAENSPDRAVPELQTSLTIGKSLVSIPRIVNDDYEIWHTRGLNHEQTIKLINREIKWMKNIGGVYMFSFHTQYMGNQDNIDAIAKIIDKLKESYAYFATAKDIADWWRFRTNLQKHNTVTEADFSRFNPVLLQINEEGELLPTPMFMKTDQRKEAG